MRLEGGIERRLVASIQRSLFRIVRAPDAVHVEETDKDGRADVLLSLPSDCLCIEWKVQGKIFGFLNDTMNADGAFFVVTGDGSAEAHVVECKRTVTQDAWSRAKRQMRSTLLRLRALAGVLGLELRSVVCYTAFCADELSPESLPEPAELKLPIGDDQAETPEVAIDLDVVRRQFDWEEPFVHLPDFAGSISHRKLALELVDGRGVGTFRIGG